MEELLGVTGTLNIAKLMSEALTRYMADALG
jgi:hypothetical protein